MPDLMVSEEDRLAALHRYDVLDTARRHRPAGRRPRVPVPDPPQLRPADAGLGLSIVTAIVDAHGGVLAIDSDTGHGATVTVRLPRHL